MTGQESVNDYFNRIIVSVDFIFISTND